MEPAVFLGLLFTMLLLGTKYGKSTFNTCNRYTSFGYGYRDFFEFKEGNFSPNQVFYLEFYVRTTSDAHILLKSDVAGDDSFEIVIGGGSNTFSQIRLLEKEGKKTVYTRMTENLLSGTDYREFWISMDHLGVMSVGNKEDEVFINWRFDNPFPIKYFSFGSWTNTKADWRFGCKNDKEPDIVEESENLTPLRRLKKDLFTLYDPNALPVDKFKTLEVKVNFVIHNVHLNEKRGELSLFGQGHLEWPDGKIRWKPENYNGIEDIYIPPFQIWTPSIQVLNALAVDKAPLFDLAAAGVMVRHDGSVFWRPPFKSVSSCAVDLKYWPSDVHNCSVYFGFWMEPSNLVLTVMDEYESVAENRAGSEWEILELIPFNSDHDDVENFGIIYVELLRLRASQPLLFTVPYVASVVMCFASFWVPFKLLLTCGSLVVQLIILFLIGETVPAMTENVPRIIQVYSWTAVATCIPLMLFVLLKNVEVCIRAPESVSKRLNHGLVHTVFCLPELPEDQTEYANLNDEQYKLSQNRLSALHLLTIIERLFFFVYLIALLFIHTII